MADIVMARIDNRLLHGQTVTQWRKFYSVTKIIVINNELKNDSFVSQVLLSAAPSDIIVKIYDEDTAIKFWEMNQFKEGNVMILFKDPQSCLRVLERGLKVPFINLGIMPKTNDKVMLVAGTFVNEEDMSCIHQIHDLNISVFAQLTPDLKKTEYSDLIQIYGKK